MRIHAEVRSDDLSRMVQFDALPWFEQASETEIVDLMRCGFGGDYPADDVAWFFALRPERGGSHYDARIADILNGCVEQDIGFECHIREADALDWIERFRPSTLIQHPDPAVAARAVPRLPQAQVERLLEHEAREIRTAAILALGRAREAGRRCPPATP